MYLHGVISYPRLEHFTEPRYFVNKHGSDQKTLDYIFTASNARADVKKKYHFLETPQKFSRVSGDNDVGIQCAHVTRLAAPNKVYKNVFNETFLLEFSLFYIPI